MSLFAKTITQWINPSTQCHDKSRARLRIVASVGIALGMLSVPSPSDAKGWVSRHGLNAAQYQAMVSDLVGKGFRPRDIEAYSVRGQSRFAAIFVKRSGPNFRLFHGLDQAGMQQKFNEMVARGFRPVDVSGYTEGGKARFAAHFEKSSGPALIMHHNLSAQNYQRAFQRHTGNGFRLTHIDGFRVGQQVRFNAIFEQRSGPGWQGFHNLDAKGFQDTFETRTRQGFRLTKLSQYSDGNKQLFAAIFVKRGGKPMVVRHGLNAANYQTAAENQYYGGYAPRLVSVEGHKGTARFSAIWNNGVMRADDRRSIDRRVQALMKKFNVPGLSLAIARQGKLVFAQGYGRADRDKGLELGPRHLMRIASISKPVTAVAAMRLVEQGQLRLNAKVFGPNSILGSDFGTAPLSQRVRNITVNQLLTHTAGGWSNRQNDPMFSNTNLNHNELVSWVLDNRPLDTQPGTDYAYSNFGYSVLGRIIEKVSRQTYEAHTKAVLAKAGIRDMHVGGDRKRDRRPNEVVYYSQSGRDPYGMKVRRMDAHGGWIASPIELVMLLNAVDGNDSKPDLLKQRTTERMMKGSSINSGYAKGWATNGNNHWHNGSLPGTYTVMVTAKNGFNWAVLTNTRPKSDEDKKAYSQALDRLVWRILEDVGRWPAHDL